MNSLRLLIVVILFGITVKAQHQQGFENSTSSITEGIQTSLGDSSSIDDPVKQQGDLNYRINIDRSDPNYEKRSHKEGTEDTSTLEVVQLPQNRIPLRFLQRNRYRPVETTPEPDSAVTNIHPIRPIDNMIIDKRVPAGKGSGHAATKRNVTGTKEEQRNHVSIPAPQLIDPSKQRQHPANEEFEYARQLEKLQSRTRSAQIRETDQETPLPQVPEIGEATRVPQVLEIDETNRNQLETNSKEQTSGERHTEDDGPSGTTTDPTLSSVGNNTDSNDTTPFPLPVPLNSVPFHLRPQQEIKNRVLLEQWQKSGLNWTDYLTTSSSKPTSTSSASTTVSTTAATTVNVTETAAAEISTAITASTAVPIHSYLMTFLANKHSNAREYLRDILQNKLEQPTEKQVAVSDDQRYYQQDYNDYMHVLPL